MRAVNIHTKTLSVLAAVLLAALIAPLSASAENGSTLHAFRGGSDGSVPFASLTSDSSGNLYGTTSSGGGFCQPIGCGTVFKLTPAGKESILYSFEGGSDGSVPSAGVILDGAGNIYGTTAQLGAHNFGTVFKLTPNGSETVLYSFQGGSDGIGPTTRLVADPDGALYGTTAEGGGSANCQEDQGGCGTVFKLTPDGQESVLYAFQGGSDGWLPRGGLTRDQSGNFYGTTFYGGNSANCDSGCGTVFKLSPDGVKTVLYTFEGHEGALPAGGVILDKSGNLYGTTGGGGTAFEGTVFRLASDGTQTTLYSFKGGLDGAGPYAGLVVDKQGNFYGTTGSGGSTKDCHKAGCGTAFKLTPKGKESVLLTFDGRTGIFPFAGLLLGKHGTLYGTTQGGGKYKNGVVFQVKK